GSLSIAGSADKLHIPWAFAKGVRCVLAFDKPPVFWFLGNEDHIYDIFSNYSIDLYKNEFLVSRGNYNLLAFNDMLDSTKIVIKSNLLFQSSDSVKVNFTEAVNRIELEGKDKNGQNLFPLSLGVYSIEYRFPRTSDGFPLYFTNFVSPSRVHMVSNVSGPIVIYPSGFALPAPNEVHVLEFDSLKGINSSVKLVNDYSKMFEQQVTINFPSFTNSPMAHLYGSTVRQVDETTSYYSMYFLSDCNLISKVGNVRVFLPDPSPAYKLSRPAVSFLLYTDQSSSYPLYYSQPLIAHNNKAGFSVLYNPPAYTFMESPHMGLQLKSGLSFMDGLHLNNYFESSTIFPNSAVYGLMNELRIDAVYKTEVKIFDEQNNLIKEGLLVKLSPMSVPMGKYRTEMAVPKYGLERYYGELKLTSRYDLSKEDPDPPVINSVQVRNSKGAPDNWLQKGESAALLFAMGDCHIVYDPYERLAQYPVVDDSTSAFVKLHDSEIWNKISISKISADQVSGCIYSADLSAFTNYDSAAIDLKLRAYDNSGNSVETVISPIVGIGRFDGAVSVNDEENTKTAVKEFTLYGNYPNPFNPATTINYVLPKDLHVELSVYDMLGREVKMLVHEQQNAGVHKITFESGSLSSGIYIYRIKAGQYTSTHKMLLLK
ncbi:MAG: T9SS type A sorting domain-containing protein, partial [Bacillota bacterium]